MKEGKEHKKKKVLVIVAHPDDEIIWMGGVLLMNKDKWNTTIISLCRRDDKDRAPKFKKVCKILNVRGHISNLEDEKLNKLPIKEIIKRIKKFKIRKNYDCIFTHGKNGEYGHIRHKEVNRAVEEMLDKKDLSCKKLFLFSYIKKDAFCCVNKNADKFIRLKSILLVKKKYLIHNIYGFNRGSFEEKSSGGLEAFKL